MKPMCNIVLASVVGALSVLGYAFKISFDARGHRAPTAHVYLVSPLSCVKTCRCVRGCDHVLYNKRRLHCELVPHRETTSSYNTARRIGFVQSSLQDEMAEPEEDVCSSETLSICREPVTEGAGTFLGNMNTEGSRRLLQCPWGHELDGLNATTCDPDADWSNHGTCERVANSTIREYCSLDSDCFDKRSECRSGQCWCKPGLSHDPNTLLCVDLCPGQYGSTFQIVKDHGLPYYHEGMRYVGDLDECMNWCLRYSDYVCKYVDYHHAGMCMLNKIPDNVLLSAYVIGYPGYTFLQRDCALLME